MKLLREVSELCQASALILQTLASQLPGCSLAGKQVTNYRTAESASIYLCDESFKSLLTGYHSWWTISQPLWTSVSLSAE